MKWTISRQILTGYTVSLVFVLILGCVAFRESADMLASFEERQQAGQITRQVEEILSLMQGAETGQKGFIITGADRYFDSYKRAAVDLPKALDTLERDTKASGSDTSAFFELRTEVTSKLDELEKTIELRRTGGLQAAAESFTANHGRSLTDSVRQMLTQIKDAATEAYDASNKRAQTDAEIFMKVLYIGLPISLVATIVIGVISARSISRPLGAIATAAQRIETGNLDVTLPSNAPAEEIRSLTKSFSAMVSALKQSALQSKRIAAGDLTIDVRALSADDVVGQTQADMVEKLSELIKQVQGSGLQVNSSAVEMAASGKQQQSTASEMAATTTEIGATAKEMSATSTELLKAADNVNAVSQELAGLASEGQEGLGRLGQIMGQIMEASSSITARLGEMNDRAGTIGTIVTTITKIADQTNLLSLNAAIEAEKAGEYGRGFSVVASEIRRLADQTAASTLDIEHMVKEMLSSVSAGVMGMDKFSEEVRRSAKEVGEVSHQIDQMIERVQAIAPIVESVYEGMQAQNQGAAQISDALSQLGESARQTAEAIRDSNRAVEQLNEASRGLQEAVSQFKLR